MQQEVAKTLKRGEWRPVFKQEDQLNGRNYRPITILNTINKVFESRLSEQTTDFLENHLSIYLTAYRKKNSTKITLLRLVGDWKALLENRVVKGVLLTDMNRAFDSIYPDLLLEKLKQYDLLLEALLLVKTYFEERQNQVKLGQTRS